MIGPGRLQWPFAAPVADRRRATASVPIIAIALVGGGYHYATDTIGGLLVAIACVLSVALLIDAIAGQPERLPSGAQGDAEASGRAGRRSAATSESVTISPRASVRASATCSTASARMRQRCARAGTPAT